MTWLESKRPRPFSTSPASKAPSQNNNNTSQAQRKEVEFLLKKECSRVCNFMWAHTEEQKTLSFLDTTQLYLIWGEKSEKEDISVIYVECTWVHSKKCGSWCSTTEKNYFKGLPIKISTFPYKSKKRKFVFYPIYYSSLSVSLAGWFELPTYFIHFYKSVVKNRKQLKNKKKI